MPDRWDQEKGWERRTTVLNGSVVVPLGRHCMHMKGTRESAGWGVWLGMAFKLTVNKSKGCICFSASLKVP